MDLAFTDEQQFLREAVRGIVDRDSSLAQVRDWVLGEIPDSDAAHGLLAGQGFPGIGIDEDAGGQGGGAIELAILAEELGRGAVPSDALYAGLIAALTLARSETQAAAELLEAAAGGELRIALAHPSPAPISAGRSGPGGELVLGAPGAERMLFWDGRHLAVFEGDTFATRTRMMVDRTRSLGDVVIAGEPAERFDLGAEAASKIPAYAAVIVAADALGASQRMLDLTVAYIQERIQFGVPVGSFQAVKHAASEMLTAIEGTRGTIHYAAWALDADHPDALIDCWVAKLRASRAAFLVADKALFLHGAIGYTWEHDLQLLFKRAKSDAQLFGGPTVYEDLIADSLQLLPG